MAVLMEPPPPPPPPPGLLLPAAGDGLALLPPPPVPPPFVEGAGEEEEALPDCTAMGGGDALSLPVAPGGTVASEGDAVLEGEAPLLSDGAGEMV